MEILTPTNTDHVPAALNDPRANLLRPAQMMEHHNDLQVAENDLENPKVQDKGAVRQRIGNLKRQYESQAPRPITHGPTKDALKTELDGILEKVVPGMLSKEEMRKNPPGSVDKHLRWERTYKKDLIRAKKILCLLNADTSDPHTWDRDAANLERFRPDGPQDRFRADAQIPGKMSYGAVPEENWKQTFGSVHPETSALKQAERAARIDPLRAAIQPAQTVIDSGIGLDLSPIPPTPLAPAPILAKRQMSEERKELLKLQLARGREAAKARRLAAKGD